MFDVTHRPYLVSLLALTLLCSGCGATGFMLGRPIPPAVHLAATKINSFSDKQVDVTIFLYLYNPNSYSLSAHDLTYSLKVADAVVAKGIFHPQVSAPPQEPIEIAVPLQISLELLINRAEAGAMIGEIPFTLDATLSVGSLFFQRDVEFSESSVFLLNLPLGLSSRAHARPLA